MRYVSHALLNPDPPSSADLNLLKDPPPASTPRLVPGYDPLLQTRNRSSLVADRAHQRLIWRSTANPGVVIAHDEIVGTWRARKPFEVVRPHSRSGGPAPADAIVGLIAALGRRSRSGIGVPQGPQ